MFQSSFNEEHQPRYKRLKRNNNKGASQGSAKEAEEMVTLMHKCANDEGLMDYMQTKVREGFLFKDALL